MRAALGLSLVALTLLGASAVTEPAAAAAWIDAHAHLVGPGGFSGAPAAALSSMDANEVRKAVLMPPPQIESRDDYDALSRIVRGNPGRFAFLGGGGTLNPLIHGNRDPSRVTDSVREQFARIAETILAAGAAGFGEIAVLHASLVPAHPYEEVVADHPLMLLLADTAARRNVIIDLHMDLVVESVAPRGRLGKGGNPAAFQRNLEAFERLLAHNRGARFVWAHAGSDFIGDWTTERSRALLSAHPNLYMSLRLGGGLPGNRPLDDAGRIRREWLDLLQEFPERFVIGTDSFHVGNVRGGGPGTVFSQGNEAKAQASRALLAQLPPELARKIGYENAERLYNLHD